MVESLFGIKIFNSKGKVSDLLEFKDPKNPESSKFYTILSSYDDIIKSTSGDEKQFKQFIKELENLVRTFPMLQKKLNEVDEKDKELYEFFSSCSRKFSEQLNHLSSNTGYIFQTRNNILQEIARLFNAWLVDHNS